jgi:hypothetical protein
MTVELVELYYNGARGIASGDSFVVMEVPVVDIVIQAVMSARPKELNQNILDIIQKTDAESASQSMWVTSNSLLVWISKETKRLWSASSCLSGMGGCNLTNLPFSRYLVNMFPLPHGPLFCFLNAYAR